MYDLVAFAIIRDKDVHLNQASKRLVTFILAAMPTCICRAGVRYEDRDTITRVKRCVCSAASLLRPALSTVMLNN